MRIGINGTGVAGPALAYWLRRFGHQPVLFEKAPVLRGGGYVIDFWGKGYELAERMGLIETLRARSYLMQRLSVVDGRGTEVASVDVGPLREAAHDRFISVARSDLALTLFDACAGIPAHFGVSIVNLEHETDGVVATLSDQSRERFDLVVGADGLHSEVRHLLFGADGEAEVSLGCHVAAFRLRDYPHRDELVYVSHTVPKRQAARVALRDGETLILLIFRSELLESEPTRAEQKDAVRRAFAGVKWEVPEILERLDGVDDLYFDRVSQIRLPRWSSTYATLLGDAAACASLLAGEGTGLAMIEAYVLAGELHRAAGNVGEALRCYEARLFPFVRQKQDAALRMRGFFAPETRFGLGLRNAAVRALAFPCIGKRLALRGLRDNVELPEYEC